VDLCTVVGVPNPDRPGSELVKLIFTRGAAHRERPDDEVIAEVRAFCQEHLGKHKVPKLFELVDELPLTAAGKVDRKALR